MSTWISSDLHFGHSRIMKFCPETRARFRDDVAFMDEAMIQEWNALIAPDDLTYILGDIAFHNAKKAAGIMRRLNGRKILVEGNHDTKLVRDIEFATEFEEIHKYLDITYDGHKIIMFHYPISEFDQQHRGSLHFHGHLHGGVSGLESYRVLDVGMDATGVIAISMEDAIKRALKGQIKKHH